MPHHSRVPAVVPALLLFAFALFQALGTNNLRDFYIFRLGAAFAARGENPYDVPKVREQIQAQYPGEDAREFVANSGYFLPPEALVLFLPFALVPWTMAKVMWAGLIGVAGYFIARLPSMMSQARGAMPTALGGNDRRHPQPEHADAKPSAWHPLCLVPFALLLNPLSLAVVVVGQYTLVFVGAVVAGLLCFERGRPYLAAVLWAIPFAKPHLAIPLIPLAWYLGGWRPAAVLVGLVAVLNALGATMAGGSPLFLVDYSRYLPTAREVVAYNRVEMNPQITSWNRLLFAWGGPLVELSAVTIVAGFVVWFAILVGRCSTERQRPSPAWAVAATAVGAVFFAQVLVYELLFLVVALPWIRGLFAGGRRALGWLAVVLLAVQLVPGKMFEPLRMDGFYHALAVGLFALLVLMGPIDPEPARSPAKTPARG